MFADDTTIYCIGESVEEVADKLNKASSELYEWCMRNQLTVHTGKTEATILKSNGFIGPLTQIMFGNAVIKYVTNSTRLGIVIDNRLMDQTVRKGYEKLLSQNSEPKRFIYLPRTVQEQIYYKAVITAITYCIAVWGTASDSDMDELDTLHAKAAKIIYNIKENCNLVPRADFVRFRFDFTEQSTLEPPPGIDQFDWLISFQCLS